MPELRMPSLGADMDHGKVVEWLVKPGDMVHRGDLVAVVDTDKTVMDVESFEDGVVTEYLVDLGVTVPVGTAIAQLAEQPAPRERTTAPAAPERPEPREPLPTRAEAAGPAELPVPAAPRGPAAPPGPPAAAPGGPATPGRVRSSPLARRLAAQLGLDLAAIPGTGQQGSVTEADVRRAVPAGATQKEAEKEAEPEAFVGTFSGGMARRLEIARAMLHTPSVLFLDEPTIGLDPQTRSVMWEDILGLRRDEGVTVFLTTHYMDEAEVADRIGIIDHGHLIALGTPEELKAAAGAESVILHTDDDDAARRALSAAGYTCSLEDGALAVQTDHASTELPRLMSLLGDVVRSALIHEPSLDDMFLHYTGRQIRDQAEGAEAFPRAWRNRR